MPSVRDKASQFSLQRHRNVFYSALHKSTRHPISLTKWLTRAPRRFDILLKNRRLGCRDSDMPRVGEEQVFVTKEIASPRSPNRTIPKKVTETTHTNEPARSQSKGDAEERGQDRPGSLASNNSGQAKHHSRATKSSRTLNVSPSLKEGRQAAEAIQSDVKLSASSAAYLEYQIKQHLGYRKRRIVESLMARIVECIEKKLDALEEGCDGGDDDKTSSPSSQPASSGSRSGKQPSQAAGQKRHHRRDDGDEDNSNDDGDDDDGSRKNHHKKKTKKISDDTRPKFACPFYKFDPQTFKSHRTCLGPGWPEVHRVKEHLKRSHMISPHQCNRCLKRFKDDDELRAHQRLEKPCPVKDPNKVQTKLADGFDGKKWDLLQKRTKKSPEEKWKDWFCILFELDPSSSDIPSPYHEIPYKCGGKQPALDGYRSFYMDRVVPMIRYHIGREVEKAMLTIEPGIRSNVMDIMKDLPRRIMDSIPPPPPTAQLADGDDAAVLPAYDYLDVLENVDLGPGDAFPFAEINDEADFLAGSDSSAPCSSSWSDLAMLSSNTSFQDDHVPPSFLHCG